MRLAAVAAAALFLAAGCGGGSDEAEAPTPQPPPTEVQEVLAEVERPGLALRAFVRAAASGDEKRMWRTLSAPTRDRLGPSLRAFRQGAAESLEQELEALGPANELFLSQTISPPFAVAAVARGSRVYAAALRLENDLWRVELDAPLALEPLRPKPGETVKRRTLLAAEVKAGTPILEAGLWLDGRAFPSRGGGPTRNALTMFGEADRLRSGSHSVVAFASTAAHAAAQAWSFRAVR